MVAYVVGSCSREESAEFETHCLSCNECMAILAILAIVLQEKAPARLHRSGVDAARAAREDQKQESRRPLRANNQVTSRQPLRLR
jgi:hypothetical protein